eukprot:scaffold18849_cov108-Skeletonema_menzelii.AAC.1
MRNDVVNLVNQNMRLCALCGTNSEVSLILWSLDKGDVRVTGKGGQFPSSNSRQKQPSLSM